MKEREETNWAEAAAAAAVAPAQPDQYIPTEEDEEDLLRQAIALSLED